jgi:tetratricopeptide (TPR) repeat protein
VRLILGSVYIRIDDWDDSIAQYDLWIADHAVDARLPMALGGRCYARAALGKDLSGAMSDCNGALKRSADPGGFKANLLTSRGLVRLRMGDYAKAVADYDDALKIEPKNAWALYGRGIAKSRQKNAAGDADISAATALSTRVAAAYKQYGILP